MRTEPFDDPAGLLVHDAFLRALARRLLADRGGAEDVVQETWLAALSGGPTRGGPLRAWLARVVRNLASKQARGARRRRAREEASAAPEAVPSPEDIARREAARRAVVAAVLRLPESYRAPMLLRYFEGLPPRRIAARLGLPVETVRTRIKRALERLREELDGEHGGERRAWAAALLPLAGKSAWSASVPWIPVREVIAMAAQAKLAVAGAAAAMAAFVWFLTVEDGGDARAPESGALASSAAFDGPTLADAAGATAATVERAAAPASAPAEVGGERPAESSVGQLSVRVAWGRDGSPAAGVGVRVYSWQVPNPYFNVLQGETGGDGTCRFDGLPPGRCSIFLDRGGHGAANVVAGECAEAVLEVPPAGRVLGTVVDAGGIPVPGAGVFLSDQGLSEDGRIAATAGADGRFEIRDVGSLFVIGARASGYEPSPLVQLIGSDGSQHDVKLVLARRGGAVGGLVTAPDGAPVAGARIRIGENDRATQRRADGELEVRALPLLARTDAAGRFLVEGVAAGEQLVRVRANGYAPFAGMVGVQAGSAAILEVRLQPGVRLFGTVRDSAGEPVSGVQVTAGGRHGEFSAGLASSGKDGTYAIDGLAAGDIEAHADSSGRGAAQAVLHAAYGQEIAWDPVLATGLSISGTVLSAAGTALADAAVSATPESFEPGEQLHGSERVSPEGRFRIDGLRDVPYTIDVFAAGSMLYPSVRRRGVRPGGAPLALSIPAERLPSVHLRGVVVDLERRPIAGAQVTVSMRGVPTAPIVLSEAGTGAFALGPLPPAAYSLMVSAAGHADAWLPARALAPNETWDAGVIALSGTGSLLVTVRFPAEAAVPRIAAWITDPTCEQGYPAEVDGSAVRAPLLPPGQWQVRLRAEGHATRVEPFAIAPGAETRLAVDLERGLKRTLRIAETAASEEQSVRFEARRSDGGLADASTAWRASFEAAWSTELSLAPGRYRIAASAFDGRSGSAEFEVAEGGAEVLELRLD